MIPAISKGKTKSHVLLGCYSNFTFLKGASHPDEMVARAATLGWSTIGIADVNSLAGIVRAHVAARDHDIRLLVGARLRPVDGPDILVHPCDREGYEGLSMLLSNANMRGSKAAPLLYLDDIARLPESTALLVMPPRHPGSWYQAHLQTIREIAKGQLFAGICLYWDGADAARCQILRDSAATLGLRVAAAADALYHVPARRPLADVLSCIREKQQLDHAGYLLSRNAERHLIDCDEAKRRWQYVPGALEGASVLASLCHFSMDDLSYEYPSELKVGQRTVMQELSFQTWQGAEKRYPDAVPDQVTAYLKHELTLIERLNIAAYFLTVFDIVCFARGRGILCQGRGSAANSAVCYCLGITAVDPERSQPLFERFVSEARDEPPDIDVDFEHERREEVIQHIYTKYGRHRAGLAASVITYRRRSALREVAKVFGLSRDVQAALAGEVWGGEKPCLVKDELAAVGLDTNDRRLRLVLRLVEDISRFPRHLSQHAGGFVITRGRLDHLCPISPAVMVGRTFIEWDKDDLDALGLLKVDVLALGMLSCIRRAFDLLLTHYNRPLTLASVPSEDIASYDMLCRGQSVGVFQVESRAQMAMLPRLQPRCFYDLVVQVAIVRPGPIQGDMVHPYLRRRAGLEKVDYPSPELHKVLERTLGVPLFQEQAMQIAIVAAGFSGGEADQLRRAMAASKKQGEISYFREKMIKGMIERGYEADFALRCFRQIEGFGAYGFPESHAASFALLVYVSAWLKCHYPDVFTCALLNAQPMGFYAPSQLIAEAKRNGISIRPVDVNFSSWDHGLELDLNNTKGHHALRLGLRLVKGLPRGEGERIVAKQTVVVWNQTRVNRVKQAFSTLDDIMRQVVVSVKSLQAIAHADGFSSLGIDRQQALWEIRGLARHRLHDMPLFAHAGRCQERLARTEPAVTLPKVALGEKVAEDYRSLGLSLKAHPLDLLKKPLLAAGWQVCSQVQTATDGKRLCIAGLVTMRQRPATASGTVFITLEDGYGTTNVIIWLSLTRIYREELLRAKIIGVVGCVQRQQATTHIIAESLCNLNGFLHHIDVKANAKKMLV